MGLFNLFFGRAGGDGTSAAQAVVVKSISQEYTWIKRYCPGFQLQTQALQDIEGKPYDILTLCNAVGEQRTIYFDISQFFGKF